MRMRSRWLLAFATSGLVCSGCSEDDSGAESPQDASTEQLADARVPDVSGWDARGDEARPDGAPPDVRADAVDSSAISDAHHEADGYPALPNLAGHALLPTSDGVSGTQVLDWEAATQGVFNKVQFDAKDIVVFGKRGIVRYLDVEHGI